MGTIYSKQEFLDIVERERARTDRMGNYFSIITFNLNKLKNEGVEKALGDLFLSKHFFQHY